jgi:hypothetical protein
MASVAAGHAEQRDNVAFFFFKRSARARRRQAKRDNTYIEQ